MGTTVSIGYLRDVFTPFDFVLLFFDNILTFSLECIRWFLSPRCGLTSSRHLRKVSGFFIFSEYLIYWLFWFVSRLQIFFILKLIHFTNEVLIIFHCNKKICINNFSLLLY